MIDANCFWLLNQHEALMLDFFYVVQQFNDDVIVSRHLNKATTRISKSA